MFDITNLISMLEPVHVAYAVVASFVMLLLSIIIAGRTALLHWRTTYNTRQLVLCTEKLDKELKRFEDMLTTTRTMVLTPEVFADEHPKKTS